MTNIVGGGAYHASDKVIQHNGCGRVNVCTPSWRPPLTRSLPEPDTVTRSSTSMPKTTERFTARVAL